MPPVVSPATATGKVSFHLLPYEYPEYQIHIGVLFSAWFHPKEQFPLLLGLPTVAFFHSTIPTKHRQLLLDAVRGSKADP